MARKSWVDGHDDSVMIADFRRLWQDAESVWDERQNETAFGRYVSADYSAIYETLRQLRGRIHTVLEWGSGLGVVTIMAGRMGFEAYGIEAEPELVELAETLAREYFPRARFATGSFIPDAFQWDPCSGDEFFRTIEDEQSGYGELDMELRDFDLVYAYPWPSEHSLYRTIMRLHGHQEALLMTYDAREGIALTRAGSSPC